MKRIDIFTHIWPQPYFDALIEVAGELRDMTRRVRNIPMIVDLDRRFEVMDMFEDYVQILSLGAPQLEVLGGPETALKLSRIGSDAMAELCLKYPDRFPGFIGTAPLSNPDAAVEEARRAIEELGACGMQVYTNVGGKPLDLPEYAPFFDYMASSGKPVWLHPARGAEVPDYITEQKSLYEIWWTLGWPYETQVALSRLIFSKTLDRLPNLKIITHHTCGYIPVLEGRIGPGWDQLGERTSGEDYVALRKSLKNRPIDYFKTFYADTASFGSRSAILAALDFFDLEKILFASDSPFDPEGGTMYIRETINILDNLDIGEAARRAIYQDNAVKLLGLKI